MSEYISKDDLTNVVWRNCDMQDLYLPVHFLMLMDFVPTADVVERKHGKWEFNNPLTADFMCSECLERQDICTPYCPCCGAHMRFGIEPDTSSEGESDDG